MTGAELMQFEVIRMVAASLIGVSIVLLGFVAMTGPLAAWAGFSTVSKRGRGASAKAAQY